jgi:hypothetical protein
MNTDLIEISRGITYVSGGSIRVDIPNNISFNSVVIVHNAGTPTGGGSYIANTILQRIQLFIRGKEQIGLIEDVDNDTVPYAIQMLREFNKLKAKVADPAEYFILNLPSAVKVGHAGYLNLLMNTFANISSGTISALTSTFDVYVIPVYQSEPERLLDMHVLKFAFAANTGYFSNQYLNANEAGYKTKGILLCTRDGTTLSDTSFARIVVKSGSKTIAEGTIAKFRVSAQKRYGIATATGFAIIALDDYVSPTSLKVDVQIDSAGTAINLDILQISVK